MGAGGLAVCQVKDFVQVEAGERLNERCSHLHCYPVVRGEVVMIWGWILLGEAEHCAFGFPVKVVRVVLVWGVGVELLSAL